MGWVLIIRKTTRSPGCLMSCDDDLFVINIHSLIANDVQLLKSSCLHQSFRIWLVCHLQRAPDPFRGSLLRAPDPFRGSLFVPSTHYGSCFLVTLSFCQFDPQFPLIKCPICHFPVPRSVPFPSAFPILVPFSPLPSPFLVFPFI